MKGAPGDWSVVQVRDVAREVDERLGDDEPPVVLSVTKHFGIVPSSEYFDKAVHSRDLTPYKLVRRGQFAYATIHLDEGSIGIQRVAPVGIVSPMYTVFEATNGVDADFLLSLLKSPLYLRGYVAYSQGSVNRRLSISFDALSAMPIAIPPPPEQAAVKRVLSVVSAQIEAETATLSALTTQKRAVMARVFAKLAQHPSVRLAELLAKFSAGRSPECGIRPAAADEWGVLKVSAVTWGEFREDENKAVLPNHDPDPSLEVRPGDLLMTRANTADLVGAAVLVGSAARRHLLLSDKTWRLEPKPERLCKRFLLQFLRSPGTRARLAGEATGSSASMKNISKDDVRNLLVPCISLDEQRSIADIGEAFDLRIAAERAHLDALRELKRGLADALLSGRVRLPPHLIASLAEGATDARK